MYLARSKVIRNSFKMSTKTQLIFLSVLALSFYFICWIWLDFELSLESMFSSTDSKGYLEIINWMFDGTETLYTDKRPMLFPILIGIPYQIAGAIGIWIFQIICWLLTINFTFLGAKKWSGKQSIAWISAGVIAINLTLISLTFQGLTEIVTCTLLSIFFYHITSFKRNSNSTKFGNLAVLILISLTLVKPLFYYPTLLAILLLIIAYAKQYRRNPKLIIYPLIILLPLLLQMTFVKVNYGSFTVSTIGKDTFTNYYFSKCVSDIDHMTIDQSIDYSNKMSTDEKVNYMLENKGEFAFQFFENIELNIKGEPIFLKKNHARRSTAGYSFMTAYNQLCFPFHILGALLLIVSSIIAFFKKEYQMLIPLLFVGGLSSYFIITSGLSFWQGDRLVIPAIAIWVPLYVTLIYFNFIHRSSPIYFFRSLKRNS